MKKITFNGITICSRENSCADVNIGIMVDGSRMGSIVSENYSSWIVYDASGEIKVSDQAFEKLHEAKNEALRIFSSNEFTAGDANTFIQNNEYTDKKHTT